MSQPYESEQAAPAATEDLESNTSFEESGTLSADADRQAGFEENEDETADDGLTAESDRPGDSHQADVDAGYDGEKDRPPSV